MNTPSSSIILETISDRTLLEPCILPLTNSPPQTNALGNQEPKWHPTFEDAQSTYEQILHFNTNTGTDIPNKSLPDDTNYTGP